MSVDFEWNMDHGIGGGDPDYDSPEPPDHFPECPECEQVVRPEAMPDGARCCEDCRTEEVNG